MESSLPGYQEPVQPDVAIPSSSVASPGDDFGPAVVTSGGAESPSRGGAVVCDGGVLACPRSGTSPKLRERVSS